MPNLGAVVTLFDSDWLLLIWSYIITKAWSVDHTIIVIYINGVCYEGILRGPRGPKNTEYLLTIIQPFWDLIRSHEISQYLLRSPKIFWGIIRYTEISSINWFDILHLILILETWHLTLICFWHWYAVTFDNWYLTSKLNDMTLCNDIGTDLPHFHWWILR